MFEDSVHYYKRRAAEESAAADEANCSSAASAHRAMANRYSELVAKLESESTNQDMAVRKP